MGFHDKAAKPHLAPDAAATQERVARPRDLLPYLCTTNAVQAKKRKNAYWYSLGIPEGALLDTAFGNLYQATRTLPSLPST